MLTYTIGLQNLLQVNTIVMTRAISVFQFFQNLTEYLSAVAVPSSDVPCTPIHYTVSQFLFNSTMKRIVGKIVNIFTGSINAYYEYFAKM